MRKVQYMDLEEHLIHMKDRTMASVCHGNNARFQKNPVNMRVVGF